MIFAKRTQILISNYQARRHHAVLLHGKDGVGLMTIANELCNSINVSPSHIVKVVPEPGLSSISIDQIRQLYSDTKSIRSDELIILIDEAEKMSLEAQNALLKLIEEPPRGAKFILTTHHKQLLLPTILSRVIGIEVQPVSYELSKQMIDSLSTDKSKNTQVMFLAQGLPAKIARLMNDQEYFESQVAVVRDARALLTAAPYDKYKIVSRYTRDKEQAVSLLQTAGQLLVHAAKKSAPEHTKLISIAETIDYIRTNGNLRIHLQSIINQL